MAITLTWFGDQRDNPVLRAGSGSTASAALMTSMESQLLLAWRSILAELLVIRRYQDDWDGLGAKAPGPELADGVERSLKAIRRNNPDFVPRRVVASPDRSIVVEWQFGTAVLEAEFTLEGLAEFMLTAPGNKPERWTLKFADNNREDQWRRVSRLASATA